MGKADEASELYARALKKVREAAEGAADGVDAATEKIARGVPEKLAAAVGYSTAEIQRHTQVIIDQFDNLRNVSFDGIPQNEVDKVRNLGEQFKDGSIMAKDLALQLDGIARANPNWNSFADHVANFVVQLRQAVNTAARLKSELADVTTAGFRSAKDDKINIDIGAIEAEAYEKDALRRAALGKSQLALENEIAKVRNDSARDGKQLTEEAIERIARANIAGDTARSGEGKKPKAEKKHKDSDYERLTKSITDRTAAMIAETEAQRGINPLINDYEYAIEKARATQELLNAAQKAGVEITPEMRKEIAATAEQWALATVEANKLAEAQDRIRQNAEEMAEFQKDLTRGIVDGFIQGKKAADIFADALSKIGNKLLDIAMAGPFSPQRSNFFRGVK